MESAQGWTLTYLELQYIPELAGEIHRKRKLCSTFGPGKSGYHWGDVTEELHLTLYAKINVNDKDNI